MIQPEEVTGTAAQISPWDSHRSTSILNTQDVFFAVIAYEDSLWAGHVKPSM